MNFIDLCAGIGGIRLGLEQAGHKCVGFCEFDKFALQSYKAIHNTEGEAEFHDITKVTDDQIRELAESRRIDIIAGGFPCQAFSVAGKRQGFDDTRGTIFFEIARFIKIIKPRYFICENVKGLFSHDSGRTFRTILGAMAELGYCVEWQILNSKDYGVPQNRERIFIVGHLGNGSGRKVFPIFPTDGENPCQLQEITQGMSMGQRVYDPAGLSKTLAAVGGGQGAKTGLYVQPLLSGIDLTTNDPQMTDIARCLQARYNKGYSNRKAETTGVLVAPVLTPDREEKRQNGRRMKEPGEPAFCLNTQDRHGVAIFETEEKTEIIQRPHGYNVGGVHEVAPALTSNAYQENNLLKLPAIVDDQGRTTKKLELKDHAPTLRAQSHGNEPKVIDAIYNNREPRVTDICPTLRSERTGLTVMESLEYTGVRIRKLTPRECWRLQGFPDEYFDRAKAAGVSDSQLYKQAGNAVTVNVAAVIGRKLAEISAEPFTVECEKYHTEKRPAFRIVRQGTRARAGRAWK